MPRRITKPPQNLTPNRPRNQTPKSPLNGTVRMDKIPALANGSFYENVNLVVGGKTIPAELVQVLPNPKNLPTMAIIDRAVRNGRHLVTIAPKSAVVGGGNSPSTPARRPQPAAPASMRDVTVGDAFSLLGGFDTSLIAEPPSDKELYLIRKSHHAPNFEWVPWDDIADIDDPERRGAALGANMALANLRSNERAEKLYNREDSIWNDLSVRELESFDAALEDMAERKGSPLSFADVQEMKSIVKGEHFLNEKYGTRRGALEAMSQFTPKEWERINTIAHETFARATGRTWPAYWSDTVTAKLNASFKVVSALGDNVPYKNIGKLKSLLLEPRERLQSLDQLPEPIRREFKDKLDGLRVYAVEGGGYVAYRYALREYWVEAYGNSYGSLEKHSQTTLHAAAFDKKGALLVSVGRKDDTGVPDEFADFN